MPALSTIAAIAAIVGGAATAGTSIYEATQTPGTPKIPKTPPLTPQQNRAQEASASSALSNLQAAIGGFSPEYGAQYAALNTGLANSPQSVGNIQAALNQYSGFSAPGQTGFTPGSVGSGGGTNILDLLAKVNTGGAPPFSPTAAFAADDFKGLSA